MLFPGKAEERAVQTSASGEEVTLHNVSFLGVYLICVKMMSLSNSYICSESSLSILMVPLPLVLTF